MRSTMRSTLLRRSLLASLLALCFAGVNTPSQAQDANAVQADMDDDDNGFDPGLLGLVGLAGLLGLKRRDPGDVRSTGHRA